MERFTLAQAAAWTHGEARGEAALTAVTTDSRQIPPEALFLPIKGERFDAHDFIGKAIEKAAGNLGCVQDALIEVSVSGEESKGGIRPDELPAFIERIAQCEHVACKGLMTMAPRGDIDLARKTFAGLQNLSQMMSKYCDARDSISMSELSMGMSEDYPVAIEEGATMVRIGRGIFDDNFTAL